MRPPSGSLVDWLRAEAQRAFEQPVDDRQDQLALQWLDRELKQQDDVRLLDAVEALLCEGDPTVSTRLLELTRPPSRPLDAMRSVVKGGGYFFLGPQIPDAEVVKGGGVSRVLDLPGLYRYGYVKPSVKSKFPDEDAFVAGAAKGKFDPNSDMDERKSMRGAGGINETWWFPSGEANAVDLNALLDALYIKDNPNYSKGAVRFDLDPASLASLNIKLYTPTAFDGMMQGWGTDPWWVTKPGPWGITKNNTHEAVMQSQQFRFFKQRSLLLPTAPPGRKP